MRNPTALPAYHWAATYRVSHQLLADDPDITAGELAQALQDQITTTRKPADLAQLIGEACYRLRQWRIGLRAVA